MTTSSNKHLRQSSQPYSWHHFFDIARQHTSTLAVANIIALFSVLAMVPIPLLMPLLVDEVLLEQPAELVTITQTLFPTSWYSAELYIGFILVITVVLRLIALGLGVWQNKLFTLVAKDITFHLRHTLLNKLQHISMSEYETLGSGGVSSLFITDINAIDEFIGASISKTVIAALSLVGITIILLWIHWQLALFILLLNPVVIYFTVVLGKQVKQLKKRENSAVEIFQQSLVETLDGIQQIRASNREQHYIKRVINNARDIKSHSASFSWKSDAANRFSFGVFLIGFDIFRAVSMLMVIFSDLSIGQMMAVFGYLWIMTTPVQEILNIQFTYFSAKAALARINNLLTLKQEPEYPHTKNPFMNTDTVSVSLRNISFQYGDNEAVLKNINLEIKAGEKIALVGASGGGKSTLVQVILGIYPANQGEILFDNVPVTEIGLDVVREHVATVLQQPAMFNDSVRANLTLGREFSDDDLWQALEIAQLKKTIAVMPDKLETIIGRQGVRLSGGQQQRLAIARMLLSDPKVIILDESTSSLDSQTEARLHQALKKSLHNKTTIIIAHRLSAVKQADRVYVFEDGHIIEYGSHDELMNNNGLYSQLYGAKKH